MVDGYDELQPQVDAISLEQHVFITSFVYSYNTLYADKDIFPNERHAVAVFSFK